LCDRRGSCPVAGRLSKEPPQPLVHQEAGCDAGDSSHSEDLIGADIFYINLDYSALLRMAWRLLFFTSTSSIRKRKGEENEDIGRR
jgi:hypothetical protein